MKNTLAKLAGVSVVCFEQNGTSILCKIKMTPKYAEELCKKTRSGLYLNKSIHEQFVDNITHELKILTDNKKRKLEQNDTI